MKRFGLALVVFVAVVAAFAGAVTEGHLNLDYWGYTYGCPFVRAGLCASGIATAFADIGYGGIWMPLTFVSYMADITLFGGGWPVHHAVNVALHALNAVLVMLLAAKLLSRFGTPDRRMDLPLAAAAAFVWAVHPMRAEAVVWVASRKEELWTLFALLGVFAWLAFLRRGGVRRYLLAFALFVVSMLCKPAAVCLPVLAFALEWLLGPRRDRVLLRYLPQVLFAGFFGLVAIASQTRPTGAAPVEVFDTSLVWRLLNGAVSLGLYLWKTLAPYGIHLDYRAVVGGWPLNGALGLGVLTAVVVVTILLMRRLRGTRAADFARLAIAWYLITLVPVLGVLGTTGDKAYADRYSYLPSVILAVALAILCRRLLRARAVTAVLALTALAGAEAVLLPPVVRSFRDDVSAYRRVLADDPEHWRALRVIGCDACARRNRMEEGVAALRKSLKLRYSRQTAASLAYVLACRGAEGDFADVRRLGLRIAADPKQDREGLMLDALAIAAFREGRDQEAVRWFSAALTAPLRSHGNLHAMLNFGYALANVGRTREALDMFGKLRAVSDPLVRRRAAEAERRIRAGGSFRFAWQE